MVARDVYPWLGTGYRRYSVSFVPYNLLEYDGGFISSPFTLPQPSSIRLPQATPFRGLTLLTPSDMRTKLQSIRRKGSEFWNAIKQSDRTIWVMTCTIVIVLAVVLGIPLGWRFRGKELDIEVDTAWDGRLVCRGCPYSSNYPG